MKRRSFIESLFIVPAGMLILPRIPKPAPEEIPCTIYTPPQIITCRAGMDLEIGDPVYWDSKEGCLKKYPSHYPKEYQRVFGFVSKKEVNLSNGNSEINIRGIG